MCCLFTWMAWCFDASHRLVVFIMACLISSSVCCLLLTASLAGVAMGYNYSLAEYIDLKETNISVYIKRGVYDDEISDDFDWRRSGGGDSNIQLKDHTALRTGGMPSGAEAVQPVGASGRRSDSVFESDEQNKYEGGLMRLTSTLAGEPLRRAEPPDPPYTLSTVSTTNVVDNLLAAADNLPGGSLERLKAIQAAARVHEAKKIELATAKIPDDPSGRVKAIEENAQIHNARRSDDLSTTTDKYDKYFNQLARHPGFPGSGLSARKFMEANAKDISETKQPNRFRDAVFRGELAGWPMSVSSKPTTENFFEYDNNYVASMPTPPTVKPLLVRPVEGSKPIIDWDTKKLPENPRRTNDSPKQKIGDMPIAGKVYSDYDEAQGLPFRKKRSDGQVSGKHESFGIIPLSSTIRITQDDLRTEFLDAKLVTSMSPHDTLPSDMKKSAEKSLRFSQQTEFDIFKMKNTHKEFLTSDDNNSRVSDIPTMSDLKYFTSFGKTKKKNVHFKPRKRMDSKGYEDELRGNKQTKSIWWRISDGVHEQWNKIIVYLDKHILQMPDKFQKTETSNKIGSNSHDYTPSIFINKLVTISTKKLVNDKIYDNENENNTTTNLETSANIDHSRII